MLNLVFFGIQGSGKGTQADMLVQKYDFNHLNIGNLLRSIVKEKIPESRTIHSYISKGELVPDDIILCLLEKTLQNDERRIIFDGFPRTLEQAGYLEKRIPVKYAVSFDLDEKTALKRLSARRLCSNCNTDYNLLIKPPKISDKCDLCGHPLIQREDDYQEAIMRRIKIFHQRTKPLIALFEENDTLIRMDATEPPDIIHQKLIRRIELVK